MKTVGWYYSDMSDQALFGILEVNVFQRGEIDLHEANPEIMKRIAGKLEVYELTRKTSVDFGGSGAEVKMYSYQRVGALAVASNHDENCPVGGKHDWMLSAFKENFSWCGKCGVPKTRPIENVGPSPLENVWPVLAVQKAVDELGLGGPNE